MRLREITDAPGGGLPSDRQANEVIGKVASKRRSDLAPVRRAGSLPRSVAATSKMTTDPGRRTACIPVVYETTFKGISTLR